MSLVTWHQEGLFKLHVECSSWVSRGILWAVLRLPLWEKDLRDARGGGLGWRCQYPFGDFHGPSEMRAKRHPILALVWHEQGVQPQTAKPLMKKVKSYGGETSPVVCSQGACVRPGLADPPWHLGWHIASR